MDNRCRLEFVGRTGVNLIQGEAVVGSAVGTDRFDAVLTLWSALIEQGRDELAAALVREFRAAPAPTVSPTRSLDLERANSIREIAERRRRAPDRRRPDRRVGGGIERRRVCAYCHQAGDHRTPADCLRALERGN